MSRNIGVVPQGLSYDAATALGHAVEEARRLRSDSVGQEHILLGLLRDSRSDAARVLAARGIELDTVRRRVIDDVGCGHASDDFAIPIGGAGKQALDAALLRARNDDRNVANATDLFLALVADCDGVGAWLLRELGVELTAVRREIAD